MNNANNNVTARERSLRRQEDTYTLPLTFWREAPHAVAEPSTLYFRDETDRAEFARLFESLDYLTRKGE